MAQRLGLRTARRLMLTASRFDGAEAGRLGLADHVVDDAAGLDAVTISTAETLEAACTAIADRQGPLLIDLRLDPEKVFK